MGEEEGQSTAVQKVQLLASGLSCYTVTIIVSVVTWCLYFSYNLCYNLRGSYLSYNLSYLSNWL